MPRATVVGAGVTGLTCAVRLAEAGWEIDVLARDLPAETTSAVAGGLWLPYLAEPVEDVARWARVSLEVFGELAGHDRTGVCLMPGHLLHRSPAAPPRWARFLADAMPVQPERDPAPGWGFGWSLTAPLVHVPRYLEYLRRRLLATGATITRLPVAVLPTRGTVINCTGLAARALANDPLVRPVRGQLVLMSDPGLTSWCVAEPERPDDPLVYVLPRGQDVVVGGTATDGDWTLSADPAQADAIVERAVATVPRLGSARVLGHRVGLRPARPTVRLEAQRLPTEQDPQRVVIHCYGHGGSGVTVSWGCAQDVLAAATAAATGAGAGGVAGAGAGAG